MIDAKRAQDIAQKEFAENKICSGLDCGTFFAFAFGDEEGLPVAGLPMVCVRKDNGATSWLEIPPVENLEKLKNGAEMEI